MIISALSRKYFLREMVIKAACILAILQIVSIPNFLTLSIYHTSKVHQKQYWKSKDNPKSAQSLHRVFRNISPMLVYRSYKQHCKTEYVSRNFDNVIFRTSVAIILVNLNWGISC